MAETRVGVTGATGFVGRQVIEALLDENRASRNQDIRVLVRQPSKAEMPGEVEIFEGDLLDDASLLSFCSGMDAVIHCAAAITAPSRKEYEKINVNATEVLTRAAQISGVKKFILISSIAAREPSLSDYGATKREGENAMRREVRGMHWSILRPPPVYGQPDKNTLPLMQQLSHKFAVFPGSSDIRISLIHVQDLAKGIVAMLDQDMASEGIYEIHDGKQDGYSWDELAKTAGSVQNFTPKYLFLPRALMMVAGYVGLAFAKLTGHAPMVTPGKVRDLYFHDRVSRHNLLDQAIDWTPEIQFAEGFRQTVAWYREQGWM